MDFDAGFAELAADLFGDEVNWSKIVALYAFGARLGMRGIIVKYIFFSYFMQIGWEPFEIFKAADILLAIENCCEIKIMCFRIIFANSHEIF